MIKQQQIINDVLFSDREKVEYKKSGAKVIEKMFPLETIQYLQKSVENQFKPTDHPEGVVPQFDKFSNDFANRDEMYQELARVILAPLYDLTGEELAVTQIAILELEAGKSKGFKWHFDNYSFSFIDVDSSAHTLWLPLTPIDVNKQHGGMVWADKRDFDAKSRLQQWGYYQLAEADLKVPGGILRDTKYDQFRPKGWTGVFDDEMLESLKKESSMQLGDAFLFNRFNWHRSQKMLANGPLKKRTTIIFRVVSMDAVINKTLFNKSLERNEIEGQDSARSYGHSLDAFEDGDLVRDAFNAGVSF